MPSRHVLALVALTLIALSLVAAGCGASSSPSVAAAGNAGGNSTTTGAPAGGGGGGGGSSLNSSSGGGAGFGLRLGGGNSLKFAQCMRAHGVPKFPDPSSNGTIQIGGGSGIDPNSPSFQAAMRACQKLMPNGGKPPSPAEQAKMRQQALAFAACMRNHGVKDFPDPQFSGGKISIQIKGMRGTDLDPNNPTFKAAQQACQGRLGLKGAGPATSSSGGGK